MDSSALSTSALGAGKRKRSNDENLPPSGLFTTSTSTNGKVSPRQRDYVVKAKLDEQNLRQPLVSAYDHVPLGADRVGAHSYQDLISSARGSSRFSVPTSQHAQLDVLHQPAKRAKLLHVRNNGEPVFQVEQDPELDRNTDVDMIAPIEANVTSGGLSTTTDDAVSAPTVVQQQLHANALLHNDPAEVSTDSTVLPSPSTSSHARINTASNKETLSAARGYFARSAVIYTGNGPNHPIDVDALYTRIMCAIFNWDQIYDNDKSVYDLIDGVITYEHVQSMAYVVADELQTLCTTGITCIGQDHPFQHYDEEKDLSWDERVEYVLEDFRKCKKFTLDLCKDHTKAMRSLLGAPRWALSFKRTNFNQNDTKARNKSDREAENNELREVNGGAPREARARERKTVTRELRPSITPHSWLQDWLGKSPYDAVQDEDNATQDVIAAQSSTNLSQAEISLRMEPKGLTAHLHPQQQIKDRSSQAVSAPTHSQQHIEHGNHVLTQIQSHSPLVQGQGILSNEAHKLGAVPYATSAPVHCPDAHAQPVLAQPANPSADAIDGFAQTQTSYPLYGDFPSFETFEAEPLVFDQNGYNQHGFDAMGYDREGYDWAGFDRNGIDRDGNHVNAQLQTGQEFDWSTFDASAFDDVDFSGLNQVRSFNGQEAATVIQGPHEAQPAVTHNDNRHSSLPSDHQTQHEDHQSQLAQVGNGFDPPSLVSQPVASNEWEE